MVTKLGELKTYYQRNWEETLPNFSEGHWKTATHVTGLALPFVGILYKPAGVAISYTATSLNTASTGIDLYQAKSWTAKHAWSVIKTGAEFVGMVVSLRIGLAVHSVMNLGENLYALRSLNEMTWSQTGEKMIPIASNALYLLTLVSFSTPVAYGIIGASLLFQGGWSLYKARQAYNASSGRDIKMVDAAAHAALAGIYFTKAGNAILLCHKIYNTVERTFVLMRPASKHNKKDPNGGLSDTGRALVPKMSRALEQIAGDNHKTSLTLFTSPAAHHVQTAELIVDIEDEYIEADLDDDDNYEEEYTLSGSTVTEMKALHARTKPEISMRELVGGYTPTHVKTRTLPLKERWALLDKIWVESGHKEQGIESPAQVADRLRGAITQILDQQLEGSDLPVIVTDGTNITYYLESEILKNPANIPETAARNIKDGGMRVVTTTDGIVTEVIAVDPKKFKART